MKEILQAAADFNFFEFGLGIFTASLLAVLSDTVKSWIESIQKVLKKMILILFGKAFAKISYSYRILKQNPKFFDLTHIQSKIKNLSANKYELRAYKKRFPDFTTMEEHNRKAEMFSKVELKFDPILPLKKIK